MKVRFRSMIAALCLLLAALSVSSLALGESYSASTMRLLRYEGEVTIEDAGGNSRFVLPNVRFSSGEAMKTGEGSSASVSLDATKIVTLDAQSRVEFAQNGSHMELTLTEGTLFLDVSEKLDANETLDIKTSTMTVGIRGTIVFLSAVPPEQAEALYGVSALEERSADGLVTVFGVLEGSAQISSENGARSQVDAGQIAVIGESAALTEMTPQNVTSFIEKQLEDSQTLSRVVTACPQLFEDYAFPADGDWEFTGEVLIIAQSASKLYDGTPLTRTGDILVYNLPEMFNVTANASGAITNAGTAQNPIGSYAIYNKAGEDVTDHFDTIKTIPGQLVVDPAPMTIWTGSAEKYYDGTPLTNEEAGFDLISGNYKEEPWRDTSLVLSEENGETLYGLSGQLLVHGTNPLTGQTSQIVLNAGEKLTVQLSSESDEGSISYNIEKVSEEDIPEEILRLYADNRALLDQACADTGWNIDLINERISHLRQNEERTTVKDGLTISVSYAGGLMRQLTNARINIDSDITDYNGRALNGEEARFAEIRIDDSVVVTATGSQTEVGQSENSYQIDWGSENPNNFIVSEELGTLTVKEPHSAVLFTVYSASKTYDGTPLTSERVSAKGLPEGYEFSAKVTGSQTDAGSSKSVIYQYTITDPEGKDVTSEFEDVTLVSGTLSVEPAPLTVVTASAGKMYDGAPLAAAENAQLIGLAGTDSASVTATGSQTEVGSSENGYTVNWGSAKSENYSITEELGTLTVSKNNSKITVTSGSSTAEYTPLGLVNHNYTTEGLPAGFTLEAAIDGMQMVAGSSENTVSGYTIYNSDGDDKTDNFTNVELISGTLTVTKAKINVWSHVRGSMFQTEASYVYRGSGYPFSCAWQGAYNPDNPATAVSISDMYGGGWTEKDVGTYTLSYAVSLRADLNDKYEIGDVEFGTITITPAPLTIATESASKGYDGKPLTAGASLEGLAGVDSWASYTLTATGSITDLGSTDNTYTLDWGEIDAANYNVSESIGTLTVTKNDTPVVVTGPSASFVYSGAEVMMIGGASVTGLPDGVSMLMTPSHPEIKDAGSYETDVSYYILDENLGKEVSSYFTNITVVPGTVTVEPLMLTVDLGGGETVYNGTAQGFNTSGVSVTYANGNNAGSKASAGSSSVVVGSMTATYALSTGDSAVLQVNGAWIDAGSYTITGSLNFTAGNASNYSVSYGNNQLDIQPIRVSLNLGGRTTVFNGQNQTFDTGAVSGTVLNGSHSGQSIGVTLEYTVSGGAQYSLSIPDVAVEELSVSGAGINAGQYTVTASGSGGNILYTAANNVITIEPLKINVWALGGVFEYNGAPHSAEVDVIYTNGPYNGSPAECFFYNTNPDASVNASFQLYTGDTITVTAPGSGSGIGVYTITPSYGLNGTASNYSISASGDTIEVKLDPYSTDLP